MAPPHQFRDDDMARDHPPQPRNGLGTAALVLGLIAAVGVLIPVGGMFIAAPLALSSLVCGLEGLFRTQEGVATNSGVALTGAVLGLGCSVVTVVMIAASIGPAG